MLLDSRFSRKLLPKAIEDAYNALVSILRSRELRVGQYREIVKVIIPRIRRFDREKGHMIEEFNVLKEVASDPVCCLADIPLIHLGYHAQRYGKIAIGFHRESVVKQWFNPVFYTLHDTEVLNSIYRGFSLLEEIEYNELENHLSGLESEIDDLRCEEEHGVEADASGMVSDLDMAISDINYSIHEARNSIDTFLAFVKTFERGEFGSIYTEREWRSTKPYHFDLSDVAMIVVPRDTAAGEYHQRFVSEAAIMQIPPTIPVVPWEDLIEH